MDIVTAKDAAEWPMRQWARATFDGARWHVVAVPTGVVYAWCGRKVATPGKVEFRVSVVPPDGEPCRDCLRRAADDAGPNHDRLPAVHRPFTLSVDEEGHQ